MSTWHLTFSSAGREALYPDESLRRAAVRTLARLAGDRLALFCVVDDHVHAAVVCPPASLAPLRRSLLLALDALSDATLTPAYVRHVNTRRYLAWLVRYLLLQPAKHGLPGHPALWSGSCFPDLVGARRVAGLALQLSQVLPRLRARDLYRIVGLPSDPLPPVTREGLAASSPLALVSAASAALCAPPDLARRTAVVVRARRAVMHLGTEAGLSRGALGAALDLSRQRVHDHLRATCEPRDLLAVRTHLALASLCREPPRTEAVHSPAAISQTSNTRSASAGITRPAPLLP